MWAVAWDASGWGFEVLRWPINCSVKLNTNYEDYETETMGVFVCDGGCLCGGVFGNRRRAE